MKTVQIDWNTRQIHLPRWPNLDTWISHDLPRVCVIYTLLFWLLILL